MSNIRILVVDDMDDIKKYFSMILSNEPGFEVVGSASSGVEAITKVGDLRPDVVLMDIQMETRTAGIDASKAIKARWREVKIIILTVHEEDDLLFAAYCAGVMDYVIKTSSLTQIISAIRNVYNNKLLLSPSVAGKIINEFSRIRTQQESLLHILHIISSLTNSEFDVLKSVFEGQSYVRIAQMRYVSQATIKSQINSILKKFNMKSMKLVIKALEEANFADIIQEKERR